MSTGTETLLRELLSGDDTDTRLTPFELRDISNKATIMAARELGFDGHEAGDALDYLRRYRDVQRAVEDFRAASETLAQYRSQAERADEEDGRLDRDRIAARNRAVTALESATGRKYR